MAKGNNDLDRSLDDIIKRGKTRETKSGRSTTNRPVVDMRKGGRGGLSGGRHDVNKRVSTPFNRTQNGRGKGETVTSKRRVGAGSDDRATSKAINSRLSRGVTKPHRSSPVKRGGPIVRNSNALTRKEGQFVKHEQKEHSQPGRTLIDPKSLVITKSITQPKNRQQSEEGFVIQNAIPHENRQQGRRQPVQHNYPPTQQLPQSPYPGYQDQHHNSLPYNNGHIDSPSYQPPPPRQNNNTAAQRNIVLICNLDPRATAEDVGEACSVFGPILSCDILVDPMGRPLNEAEIEFVYSNSAEECVSKLDNGIADGRVVRARLQSSATLPLVPRYSSRTVIASARVAQGGFDNNSQHPMMHQNQNNSHYNNSPSSYPQQRQSQQYQRRYQ